MIRTLLFIGLCAFIEKIRGEDLPRHVNYLVKYGYLGKTEEGGPPDSFSSEEIVSALKEAQEFAGILATGKLDNQTIAMVSGLRCGFPDKVKNGKYQAVAKWNKKHVTYGFVKYTPKFRPRDIENLISQAIQTWAKPSGLKFTRVKASKADVKIGFFSYDHGDGDPFDGPGNVLAHATLPNNPRSVDVHFDEDENWIIVNHNKRPLLLSTAIHELGHTMGLIHSNVPGSIMLPVYTGQTKLNHDDIQGIQSLYSG